MDELLNTTKEKEETSRPAVVTQEELDALEKEFQASGGKGDPTPDPTAALERLQAEREEEADPESGVDLGIDLSFMDYDPSDPVPYVKAAGVELDYEKFSYRWVGTHPLSYRKMRARGFVPVRAAKGGNITNGDRVLCQITLKDKQKLDNQIEARKRLYELGNSATFDSEVKKQGGTPFDGPRSLRDGLR